jgi:integrase/recombinase XerD
MQYLTRPELRRLFEVAQQHNPHYRLAMTVTLWHGLRVSELINLRGSDVTPDGCIIVRRLKGSNTTLQPLRQDSDVLFDESPLLELARERKTLRLFPISRGHFHRLMRAYGAEAGIHPDKCHPHSLKHSVAMILWDCTQSLGVVQNFLGHKSPSSSLVYLREVDARKGSAALASVHI